MNNPKKPGMNTTEGMLEAWRSCHPNSVAKAEKKEELADQLLRLKETNPDAYAIIERALSKEGGEGDESDA